MASRFFLAFSPTAVEKIKIKRRFGETSKGAGAVSCTLQLSFPKHVTIRNSGAVERERIVLSQQSSYNNHFIYNTWVFVMYYIYGVSVPSLLIEATDSMIILGKIYANRYTVYRR